MSLLLGWVEPFNRIGCCVLGCWMSLAEYSVTTGYTGPDGPSSVWTAVGERKAVSAPMHNQARVDDAAMGTAADAEEFLFVHLH